MTPVDDPGVGEDGERLRVALDVELEARAAVEGPASVRADLRADAVLAEEGERPSRGRSAAEVEMEPPATVAAEVQVAGGVEERRELGAPVALTLRDDARELLSDVLRRDQRTTPSRASRRRLTATPAEPYPPIPLAATTR